MSNVSLSQLLEAGVHFGHKAYRWNPKMFPYIYSEVNNIHILDLVQSATLLKEANAYLESAASQGKKILFIGTKRQASTLIAKEAKRCDSFRARVLIDDLDGSRGLHDGGHNGIVGREAPLHVQS